MKKVLFVGQFNILYQEISTFLTRFFKVQICECDMLLDSNLLSLSQPDVILLDLLGAGEEKADILYELRNKYMDIPLVVLKASDDDITPEMVMGIKKYTALKLPAGNERIVETICEMIGFRYDRNTGIIIECAHTRKCVLAIDDNDMQLRMLNEVLKEEYDVMMANSAVKAIALIGKRVPDIILLDYEMPVCDGKMALWMIRELDESKDVPVIFLTGVQDAAHIRAVLELHPAGYLLKPAKRDMILAEIKKNIR